jgi:hypothetical protein
MREVKVRSFRALDPVESRWEETAIDSRGFRRSAFRARAVMREGFFLILLGALSPLVALGQDDPLKVEPPASGGAQKSDAPPPPGQQKKESAAAEKEKATPAEPAEPQKGAPTNPVEKPSDAPPAPGDPEKRLFTLPSAVDLDALLDAAQALSSRYKFVEKYTTADAPQQPELITQYQVGLRRTVKMSRDKAQSAPERTEWSRTCIYTERAAKVTNLGEPTDLVRRYDKVLLKSLTQTPAPNQPFLQGLSVWYRPASPPNKALVMTLTPDRPLREVEFAIIAEELSIPRLIHFFPTTPKRVSESWNISPAAFQRVSGQMFGTADYEMTGALESVEKMPSANSLVAKIDVTGYFSLATGPSAFHALIDFTFEPTGISLPARGAADAGKIVLAAGRITQAVVVHKAVRNLPEAEGRAKATETHELILQRRPLPTGAAAGAAPVAPIEIPIPGPVPTKENSWIVYDDSSGRFQFRHPQELQFQGQGGGPGEMEIRLTDDRPTGRAHMTLLVHSGLTSSIAPDSVHDPASLTKTLEKQWAEDEVVVTKGQAGWLPDEDWKELKRRVYRIESGLKMPGRERPVFADHYFVEFSRSQNIIVFSYTERDDHVAYRAQAENLIRTFQFKSTNKPGSQKVSAQPAATTPVPNRADSGDSAATPSANPASPASVPRVPPQ